MLFFAVTLGVLTCPALEPSRLQLVGVLLDDDPAARAAVLRDPSSGRSFTVHEGEVIEGSGELQVEADAFVVRRFRATVERIERGRVLLIRPHGREVAASPSAWAERRCQPVVELEPAGALAAQARIVPAFDRGKPIGFKLFSIRRGSLWSAVGLENGDVIGRVNGLDLTSPENALVVSSSLRCARRLDVEVRRGGEHLDLVLLPAAELHAAAPQLARGRGAFAVNDLGPRSLLAQAGLRAGDVVERIDDEPVTVVFSRAGQRRRLIIAAPDAMRDAAASRAAHP
ncbi:MAG: hypothetical protein JNJ54_15760 [Myxococcaceae bacterium]|nr:hypothetical protein [Myxococcaceae bacterium]